MIKFKSDVLFSNYSYLLGFILQNINVKYLSLFIISLFAKLYKTLQTGC